MKFKQIVIICVLMLKFVSVANPEQKIDEYRLGPGDEIKVIFHFNAKLEKLEYRLGVGDVIEVSFYSRPEFDKRVTITPDGMITMHRIGDVFAVGLTKKELADSLYAKYSPIFKDPAFTLTLIEFNKFEEEFQKSISSQALGNTLVSTVRPDGLLSLPLINDIFVSGNTITNIRDSIEKKYLNYFSNIKISIINSDLKNNIAFVLGDVGKPNAYNISNYTTLSQLMSRSQLNQNTSNVRSIVIVSKENDSIVKRCFNLRKIIKSPGKYIDPIIKQNDLIYVSQKPIVNVNKFVDQYINNVIPGFLGVGLNYDLKNIIDK